MPRLEVEIYRNQDVRYCLLHSVELKMSDTPFIVMGMYSIQPFLVTALLDTGATQTFFGKGIIDYFKAKEIDIEKSTSQVTIGNSRVPYRKYEDILLILPHSLDRFKVPILSLDTYYAIDYGAPFGIIIGMDILCKGEFIVNGKKNIWSLEFS